MKKKETNKKKMFGDIVDSHFSTTFGVNLLGGFPENEFYIFCHLSPADNRRTGNPSLFIKIH